MGGDEFREIRSALEQIVQEWKGRDNGSLKVVRGNYSPASPDDPSPNPSYAIERRYQGKFLGIPYTLNQILVQVDVFDVESDGSTQKLMFATFYGGTRGERAPSILGMYARSNGMQYGSRLDKSKPRLPIKLGH
ncbi:MAG TPA: hypothetical protein VJB90_02565 [Candidatus Nanoarchaeia archaeon]|nr:hypothetical protein [Candidatus Nanoarchaeia archaeon]